MKKELCRLAKTSLSIIGTTLILLSCVPLFRTIQSFRDLEAPTLVSADLQAPDSLRVAFSEEIVSRHDTFIIHNGGEILGIQDNNRELLISLTDCLTPGKEFLLEGVVEDTDGNRLWFMLPFYGANENIPGLIINEFINENSSTRYEKVEIYVRSGGNLGGVTIYDGSAIDYKSKYSFESQEVHEGEYLIVHFRRMEGEPAANGEFNEYDDLGPDPVNAAFSAQAIPGIRDFWAEDSQGLSDTNGAISIYESPAESASLMDSVLYSNREYKQEDPYGSFGTSYTWKVMSELEDSWMLQYEHIRPGDCLRTEDTTSTRSMNRNHPEIDTNSADDWHIVPTGCSSFGFENNAEVHEP